MNEIPVIKFLFQEEWSVLNDALSLNPVYGLEEFTSANDVSTFMSSIDGALVVTSVRNKNDLIQLAALVKTSKKIATNTTFKIVVVNFTHDKQFEKAIAKLGILDIVDDKINTKALRFKIDFWMKSITAQVKKNTKQDAVLGVKNLDVSKNQDKKNAEAAPVLIEPIDCEDDIWLLKNESDCKKVLSRWLVKIQGPSPYVGQWVDVENKSNLWRFDLKADHKEFFILGEGQWFFSGEQKPEFVWKENLWLITGDKFELYYQHGDTVFTRLKLKDKVFSIAKNSEYAKTKEQMIVESFDKELLFKKDQGIETNDSVDNETSRYHNLEGEGKTDQLERNPLSGKGSTDHKTSGPLSGNFNPNDLFSTDSLSLKTSGQGESDLLDTDSSNKHRKHDRAHNPTEQYGSSEQGGQSSTDKMKSHYEGKTTQKDESSESNVSNLHKDKNKRESQDDRLGIDIDLKGHIGYPAKDAPAGKILSIRHSQNNSSFMGDFQDEELEKASQDASVVSYLFQNSSKFRCQLDDFFDQSIVFLTSQSGLRPDHSVTMDLCFNYMDKDTTLKFDGTVDSVDGDGEGLEYVTVTLTEKNVEAFESFMKLYRARQTNVTTFLKRAKGF